MNKFFLIIISTLALCGCARGVWKDFIKFSSTDIVFEAEGGEQEVWSKTGSQFDLDGIFENGENPKDKEVVQDEHYKMVAITGEWLHVGYTDLNDRTSLTISTRENATGEERNGKVTVNCGDLYKTVKIRQKAK